MKMGLQNRFYFLINYKNQLENTGKSIKLIDFLDDIRIDLENYLKQSRAI
jgi:hypothetical protein